MNMMDGDDPRNRPKVGQGATASAMKTAKHVRIPSIVVAMTRADSNDKVGECAKVSSVRETYSNVLSYSKVRRADLGGLFWRRQRQEREERNTAKMGPLTSWPAHKEGYLSFMCVESITLISQAQPTTTREQK